MNDQQGKTIILAVDEPATDHLINDLCRPAQEIELLTRTPEGIEALMADSEHVFGAAIALSLACNRIKAHCNRVRQALVA